MLQDRLVIADTRNRTVRAVGKRVSGYAWAPTEAKIAYLSRGETGGSDCLLRVLDLNRGTQYDVGPASEGGGLTWAGSSIVYAKPRDASSGFSYVVCYDVHAGIEVATNAAVAANREFEAAGSPLGGVVALCGELAWVADGREGQGRSRPTIYIFDVLKRMRFSLGAGRSPAWAHTRLAVAFAADGEKPGIYVAESPDWRPRLASAISHPADLAWSPDDRWIAFVRTNRGDIGSARDLSSVWSGIWLTRAPNRAGGLRSENPNSRRTLKSFRSSGSARNRRS